MATLQAKNIPVMFHKRIRAYVRRRGCTIRDVLLEALERELERDTFYDRLQSRSPVPLPRSAGELLRDVRLSREREL